jgi:hypothetical protein
MVESKTVFTLSDRPIRIPRGTATRAAIRNPSATRSMEIRAFSTRDPLPRISVRGVKSTCATDSRVGRM